MLGVVSGLFSLVSSGVTGFFGMKEKQVDLAKTALEVLKDANSSSAEREKAVATVLVAESGSESWVTRSWRPLTMVLFVSLIMSYCFGYIPMNLMKPLPDGSLLAEIFDLLKIGLVGYIPARSVEKVVGTLASAQNTKKLIDYFTHSK